MITWVGTKGSSKWTKNSKLKSKIKKKDVKSFVHGSHMSRDTLDDTM
jgi:hypothetical protein